MPPGGPSAPTSPEPAGGAPMVPAGQLAAVQAELAAIGERLDAQTAKLDAVHEVAQVLAELLPLLTQGKFGAVIRALRASG